MDNRKPFNKTPKWLAAQERLKQERITNPEKFKPKTKTRSPRKNRTITKPSQTRSEFNDFVIAEGQLAMREMFDQFKEMLNTGKFKTNPVGATLAMKNINDLINSTTGSGAISKSKETKDLMNLHGNKINREGLIALNQSANITNLADIQQFIDK